MKHRKIGQMELVAELTAKLVPYTREAAVFNKQQMPSGRFSPDTFITVAAPIDTPWSTMRG